MIDGQVQLAVLKPETGDWTVLTHDRTHGELANVAWSSDGNRVYYNRFYEVPNGVWSISPIGGDERLVLEDAGNPQPLPDGSLLVSRLNAQHQLQLYRFHPETGRIDTLDARAGFNYKGAFFRAFPDGKSVAYWGRTSQDSSIALRVFDLVTRRSRVVLSDSASLRLENIAPIAAFSPGGKWLVVPRAAGNLVQFVAIASDGSGRRRVLFTGTSSLQSTLDIDVGPDGSVYIDESSRVAEVHRYDPSSGRVDRMLVGTETNGIVPLPGGRWLIDASSDGRRHVMLAAAGKPPSRFVQTDEPTALPGALLGRELVVLKVSGADGRAALAVVSIATGRIVKRFPVERAVAVAGSDDGKTIFFSDGDQVWSIDVATGAARRITAGTGVAIDPSGASLVVERIETTGVHLLHVSLNGSNAYEIPIRGDFHLAVGGLAANAIARDGRIAVRVVSPASWFWPVAILDPKTGSFDLTPSGPGYDMFDSGWADDGTLVSVALPVESRLWRLQPAGTKKWWR